MLQQPRLASGRILNLQNEEGAYTVPLLRYEHRQESWRNLLVHTGGDWMVPGHSFGGVLTLVVGSHALKYGDRTVSGVTGGKKLAVAEKT